MINFLILSICRENTSSRRSTLPKRNGVLSSSVMAQRTFNCRLAIFSQISVSQVVIILPPIPSAVLFLQSFLFFPKSLRVELGNVVRSAPVSTRNSNSFQLFTDFNETGIKGRKISPSDETGAYLNGNVISTAFLRISTAFLRISTSSCESWNVANDKLIFLKRFVFLNLFIKITKFFCVSNYFATFFGKGNETRTIFFDQISRKFLFHDKSILVNSIVSVKQILWLLPLALFLPRIM